MVRLSMIILMGKNVDGALLVLSFELELNNEAISWYHAYKNYR